jgi:ubiquinone/menaquinone biosynthesis C-methylase UbiE
LGQFELVDLPFDQYQRYRLGADMATLFRSPDSGSGLRVLDVGGFFRLMTGQVAFPIALFLPDDQTVTIDLVHHALSERDPSSRGRRYVEGSGVRLPFADASFDLVISCDTLEHVPPAQRPAFVRELVRVSADGLVLAAPFFEAATRQAEEQVFEYILQQFGHAQPQLAEHRENGLPDKGNMRAWLAALGMAFVEFPSGYLVNWTTMMQLKSHLFARPDLKQFHARVDRYYNLNLFDADQREPAYRHFFVASKKQEPGAFVEAAGSLIPRPPVDDAAKSPLIEGLFEIVRDAADTERALRRCRAQLAERDKTIHTIMQGRVMRLMTGVQRWLRRIGARD